MECDAFHVSYLSDKIPKAVFHGQAVKTVAYLRVSTAQQDVRSQRAKLQKQIRRVRVRLSAAEGKRRTRRLILMGTYLEHVASEVALTT